MRPVDAPISQGFGENPTRNILPGSDDYWIIEQFGNYQPDGHTGEDYSCDVGTPIRAVTSGTVIHVGNRGGTYQDNEFWISPGFAGYHYVINHDTAPGFPNGFIGIYAHGKDGGAKVSAGQRVTEGQVIGLSGNTGGSTGPHLHFEILPDQFVVNSYMYGRVDPELLFGSQGIAAMGGTITPLDQEDDLVPNAQDRVFTSKDGSKVSLEELLNSMDTKINDIPAFLNEYDLLDTDLRGDLKKKGAQITALSAAVDTLSGLVASTQKLDADQIKQAVSAAIADGIKITVEAGK